MAITGGFGFSMDLERGVSRRWVMDRDGVKRLADDGTPTDSANKDLAAYLKTQFSDLDGAKAFMARWAGEMGQSLPGFGEMTVRAMAAHCSAALEGAAVQELGYCTNHLASEFGRELCSAAWSALPINGASAGPG